MVLFNYDSIICITYHTLYKKIKLDWVSILWFCYMWDLILESQAETLCSPQNYDYKIHNIHKNFYLFFFLEKHRSLFSLHKAETE